MNHIEWPVVLLLASAVAPTTGRVQQVCAPSGVEAQLKEIAQVLERQTRAQELASALGRMQVAVQEVGILRQELRSARSEADRVQADFEDAQNELTLQSARASAANPGLPRLVTEDMLLHLRYRLEATRNRLPGLRARLAEAEEDVQSKEAEVDEWRRVFDELFRNTGR